MFLVSNPRVEDRTRCKRAALGDYRAGDAGSLLKLLRISALMKND